MRHIMITLAFIAVFGILSASTLASLYSDHKSFSTGDVLTVVITESSSATSASTSKTDRSFDHGFDTEAGQGPFSSIPLSSLGVKGNNTSKGDAQTTRQGSIKATMTVRITDIDENGNLMIKGSKSVSINGEEELTQLEGMVRPQDVGADNTVYSYNIADAQISYKGKGSVATASRVGFISRIFNFIF